MGLLANMNDLRLMTGILYYDVQVSFPCLFSFLALRAGGDKTNTYLVAVRWVVEKWRDGE